MAGASPAASIASCTAVSTRFSIDVKMCGCCSALTSWYWSESTPIASLSALTAALNRPAPEAPAPAPAAATHEVQPGDTLSAIASANGVSLDAVLSANGLTRASIIYPGDVLQIPSADAAASAAPAAVAAVTVPGLDAEQSARAAVRRLEQQVRDAEAAAR